MQRIQIEKAVPAQQEREEEIVVGIDLGTTNSLAVWHKSEKEYQILCDVTPSIITILENGEIKACDETVQGIRISSVKRAIGKKEAKFEGLTPEEVSSIILKEIKHRCESILQKEVKKCIITIPAYFDDIQRSATKKAAEMAGLEVVRLLNEPTSAAVFYDIENKDEGLYAVFDLGGGTFDISILQMKMGVIKVLAVGGNTELGGDDFDEILAKHFNISQLDARKIKEEVCKNGTWKEFSRDDFDDLVIPLVYNLVDIFKECLQDSGASEEELKGIILVGGSTKMPIIKEALEAEFNIPIFSNVDPDRIVALGASKYAFNLQNRTGNLLLDVVPLTLGIETAGGLVLKIIPRNSQIPIKVTEKLTTGEDGQTGIIFHVVQGEREFAKDCRSLATFEISNLPKMPRGSLEIELSFEIDLDGILTVSAIEKVTGKEAVMEIRPTYNLNPREIRKIFEEAMQNGKSDMQSRILEEAKIEARSIISSAKNYIHLKEASEFLPVVQNLEDAVNNNDEAKIKQLIDEIRVQIKNV